MSGPRRTFVVNPGDRFGQWEVLHELEPRQFPSGQVQRQVRARCACGRERSLLLQHLRRGFSKSCGARHKESVGTFEIVAVLPTRRHQIVAAKCVSCGRWRSGTRRDLARSCLCTRQVVAS